MPERLEPGVGLDAPARARRWIVRVCESCGLGHHSEEAALLVSELVTNAVLHARTDCVVIAEKGDDGLRVEVIDRAGDFAGVQPIAERLSAGGGRGLVIVDALATAWGVDERPEGKSVWFRLRTEVPSGHAAPTATPTFRGGRAALTQLVLGSTAVRTALLIPKLRGQTSNLAEPWLCSAG